MGAVKFTGRDLEALLRALVVGEKVKPSQVVKRIVFYRYGLVGTLKDSILTAIFYGILRKQGLVDKIIERAAFVKVEKLNPWVRAALRVATYLKHFGYADVDLETELWRSVPQIVRRYAGRRGELIYKNALDRVLHYVYKPSNEAEELEFKYSAPAWFIKRLIELIGREDAERFLEYVNKAPLLSFRVNTLKATVKEVVDEIRSEGKEVFVSPYVPTVIKLKGPFWYDRSRAFKEGKIVPQDDASAMASLLLAPKPGETVVDLCAAPGGKTTHMAELMRNEGTIYAFDVIRERIDRMLWLIEKTGVKIVKVFKEDGRKAPELLGEEIADRVLVDPPCSSTGTLAKQPEARWRLKPDVLDKLAQLQLELLEAGIKLAKPGGRILYTVCSVFPEEGEEVIKKVLKKYEGAVKLVPIKGPFSPGFMPGTMRAWPHRHRTTGFFYALLEKVRSV